jgi:hypothetical protein
MQDESVRSGVSEYAKLAEIALVMVPGSVEDERRMGQVMRMFCTPCGHATPPTSRHTAHASPHRTTPSPASSHLCQLRQRLRLATVNRSFIKARSAVAAAIAVSFVDLLPALLAPDARS